MHDIGQRHQRRGLGPASHAVFSPAALRTPGSAPGHRPLKWAARPGAGFKRPRKTLPREQPRSQIRLVPACAVCKLVGLRAGTGKDDRKPIHYSRDNSMWIQVVALVFRSDPSTWHANTQHDKVGVPSSSLTCHALVMLGFVGRCCQHVARLEARKMTRLDALAVRHLRMHVCAGQPSAGG